MPTCVAFGCQNKTGKTNIRGLSFHKYPFKNVKLLEQWVQNTGRSNFVPNAFSTLCSDHFEEDYFEEDGYAKFMLRTPDKTRRAPRKLKPDAVPTKFSHKPVAPQRSASLARRRKEQHREVGVRCMGDMFILTNVIW